MVMIIYFNGFYYHGHVCNVELISKNIEKYGQFSKNEKYIIKIRVWEWKFDLLESTIMEENHNPCLDLDAFVFKTMFETKKPQ